MEFRQLGSSGLKVPTLCFGTATFGGGSEFFRAWGNSDVKEARQLIDACLEAGVNFFDTADSYSRGLSEQILGEAIRHVARDSVLISTKASLTFGSGPNDLGSSRYHLLRQIEGSLKRLQTDYIDLLIHMHTFDAQTPMEETLSTLDQAVRQESFCATLPHPILPAGSCSALARSEPALRLGTLRLSSGLLLADRSRLRVGADAAGIRA